MVRPLRYLWGRRAWSGQPTRAPVTDVHAVDGRRRIASNPAQPKASAPAISQSTANHVNASTLPSGNESLSALQCGNRCTTDTPMAMPKPTGTATVGPRRCPTKTSTIGQCYESGDGARPEHLGRQDADAATEVVTIVEQKAREQKQGDMSQRLRRGEFVPGVPTLQPMATLDRQHAYDHLLRPSSDTT